MALLLDDEDSFDAIRNLIKIIKNQPITSVYWRSRLGVEAEQDEQGTFYGYKVLIFLFSNLRFISPVYEVLWNGDGTLLADEPPSNENRNGIYFMKKESDEEIHEYLRDSDIRIFYKQHYGHGREFDYRESIPCVVRCAISGTVVEAERGFRAEHARITGVNYDGNWKNYEDSQELARYLSYKNYKKKYERPWDYPTYCSDWP